MKTFYYPIIYLLFCLFFFLHCNKKTSAIERDIEPRDPIIDVEILKVSEISLPEQKYSIDFWLYVDYYDTATIQDYANLIRIANTKQIVKIEQVWNNYSDSTQIEKNLLLEINCVMDKNWQVTDYPFDDQTLDLAIYIPQYDSSQLNFHTNNSKISFQNMSEFETGWLPDTVQAKKKIIYDTYDIRNKKINSVFKFSIPIHRESPVFIFWKLFAGMYIAFFVAFVAFYIQVDHNEPRFGLPVGALFATVANKYVIEAFLPMTSKLTLVDWLHDLTIFSIFLIIAFSAVSLKIFDMRKAGIDVSRSFSPMKKILLRVERIKPLVFLAIYILANLIIIFCEKYL